MTAPTGVSPSNAQSNYLPTEFDLPKDQGRINELISKRERLTASIINSKEIAQYELSELETGQQWFSTEGTPSAKKTRSTFRKVINFGALPNSTTKTAGHNIAVTNKTIFTKIYGVANNPNVKMIPLPYINTGTPGDSVEIWVDPTYVNVKTTTANYVAFTNVYIVLEYIKG